MSAVEIIKGPSRCRLIISGQTAGYSIGFDAEGSAAWVSFPVGLQVHRNRGAAITAAARQIRHGLSDRITPTVESWLSSLVSERQPDLFAA